MKRRTRTPRDPVKSLFITIVLACCLVACRPSEPEVSPHVGTPVAYNPDEFPAADELVELTREQWLERLQEDEFNILREHHTEVPFHNEFDDHHEHGIYVCAGCGNPLFSSEHKFDSGTGWPSYTQPIEDGRVGFAEDRSRARIRTEIHCDRCGGHLGHVFPDGPPPTGDRYCVNSLSLDFVPSDPAE